MKPPFSPTLATILAFVNTPMSSTTVPLRLSHQITPPHLHAPDGLGGMMRTVSAMS